MALTTKRIARIISRARKAKKPMRVLDANNLYLQVTSAGVASWVFRYSRNEREHYLGLGPLHAIDLKQAQARARSLRTSLVDGIDPLEKRRAEKAAALIAAAKTKTFGQCAEQYFTSHEGEWRNRKHREQFISSLKNFVLPRIGALPVDQIDVAMVISVLEQPVEADRHLPAGTLWGARRVTAGRVRSRIEAVLDWATVRGFRVGDNPARWKGFLEEALPKRTEKVAHHASMEYAEIGEFMAELRKLEGVAPRALEFLILTGARAGETLGAQWREIDWATKTWTVPKERMKAGEEHRVPLSPRAIEILEGCFTEAGNDSIFIGVRGATLGSTSLLHLLRRIAGPITVHGFRSTFRVWAEERTQFPSPVFEQALAHKVGNAVTQAYRRTTLFEQRRKLMEMWAQYCSAPTPPAGKVLPLRKKKDAG
jgi:integrase